MHTAGAMPQICTFAVSCRRSSFACSEHTWVSVHSGHRYLYCRESEVRHRRLVGSEADRLTVRIPPPSRHPNGAVASQKHLTSPSLPKPRTVSELRELLHKLMDLPQLQSGDEGFLGLRCIGEPGTAGKCGQSALGLRQRLSSAGGSSGLGWDFSVTLFIALNRWGQHEEGVFHLEAEVGDNVLEHAERWDDRDRVVLRPDMAKLMWRGNLPGFE